jgi:hypothetical protein
MSKNKLYTKSYFKKRIVEQGFDVTDLKIQYEVNDLRKWTIIVNKQNINYKHNILITCFKDEQTKEFSFKFQGQKFDDFILPTLSMKLIIDILKKTTEMEIPEQKEGQTNE